MDSATTRGMTGHLNNLMLEVEIELQGTAVNGTPEQTLRDSVQEPWGRVQQELDARRGLGFWILGGDDGSKNRSETAPLCACAGIRCQTDVQWKTLDVSGA